MNTIEREEIFDLADDAVCAGEMEYWDKYKNNNGTKGFKTKHQCIIEHVRQAILTQVAKARKEMLCEAVGWAYADYCISLDKGDDPRKQEMSSVLERAFTDLGIRNELNQKGEQNGKSN